MWTQGTITGTITQPIERPVFFEGLLDFYTGAAVALSLDHINGSYFGPVARVRRASDDSERDVTADDLKNGTLTTWTGANDGFVVTWYDQSGNSNDATQATAASQPKIVSAGTYLGEIDFDGTDDYLETGAFSLTQAFTSFCAASPVGIDAIASVGDGIGVGSEFAFYRSTTSNSTQLASTTLESTGSLWTSGTLALASFLTNSTSSKNWFNGSETASGDAGAVNPSGKLLLGYRNVAGFF